jgi:hypothetical protein
MKLLLMFGVLNGNYMLSSMAVELQPKILPNNTNCSQTTELYDKLLKYDEKTCQKTFSTTERAFDRRF